MPSSDRLRHEEYMDNNSYKDDYIGSTTFSRVYDKHNTIKRQLEKDTINENLVYKMCKNLSKYHNCLDIDKRNHLDVFFPQATSEEKILAIRKFNLDESLFRV